MERGRGMLCKTKELLKRSSDPFYYVGATLISAGVRFLYSVFVKAHIEPLEYGIYSTCLLLQTYMTYVQLGSLNAFNRDYPQLIGAGDLKKAKSYRDTTFSFLLIAFGIVILVITAILMTVRGEQDTRYIYGMILCAISTGFTVIENFLASRVRIDRSFKYTSFVTVAELISVIIGFFLVLKIGYYGLYIVTIGSMVIGIFLYYKRGIADITVKIDRILLKTILYSGIPLLINNLIWTIVDSIDKFVILGFINTEALGLYSIAQMTFSYMVMIPNAISQLFYVKMGKIYGATGSKDELNRAAVKYTLILAIIMSFIVICAYFLMEPLVLWIMPKYSGGVRAAQILMLGLAIYSPTMVNGNILTILKKNSALLRGSIYLCILNVFCSVGLVLLRGPNIENVALGTVISYLIRTAILVYQLKHNAEVDAIKTLRASIVPVLIIAGPCIALYHLFESGFMGFAISVGIALFVVWLVYGKIIKSVVKG